MRGYIICFFTDDLCPVTVEAQMDYHETQQCKKNHVSHLSESSDKIPLTKDYQCKGQTTFSEPTLPEELIGVNQPWPITTARILHQAATTGNITAQQTRNPCIRKQLKTTREPNIAVNSSLSSKLQALTITLHESDLPFHFLKRRSH